MRRIKEFTLKNDFLEISFINLGATITKMIDLKTGINIIVGHHHLETYQTNPGYMNSIIGRNSGRTLDFFLDGKHIEVTKNISEMYQLHGGYKGFNFKYFESKTGNDSITFTTESEHLEEGYPGEVDFTITYKLVKNELHLIYKAVSTMKTVMNFTNHSYFNLSGNIDNTILNHELYLNAKEYIALDRNMLPREKVSLDNTPLDFRQIKRIGDDINCNFEQLRIGQGFDHPYLINKSDDVNQVAMLRSPESNLTLEVYSDQDVVVLYTGNVMDSNYILNNGVQAAKHYALCLETQGVPNAQNIEEFKRRNIYEANEIYHQTTIWKLK